MSNDFRAWADQIKRLFGALSALEPAATAVGVGPPTEQEWFELIENKLLPQLDAPPLLVVGIVGGTNIGKSVLFNHLAGQSASAVSPLAAGTRHPVCLVPPGADDAELLGRLFGGFELRAWQSPQDPIADCPENLMFWRVDANVPPRLLLLDTPDVDSDVAVNWQRARAIRQVADLLVAVLTQQKYNDAAVKQFFREAVLADKPIVVVFNQCDLEADQPYWPQWLSTFCDETGARPELVYVIPQDRTAAAGLRLPFYQVGPAARQPPTNASSLRDELASLHFDAIKIRTFRGALARVFDPQQGAGAYLEAIRHGSSEFAAAADALSATEMARVSWPNLPTGVLVDEIRRWWDSGRSGWSRRIHSFYRSIGRGATWPVRAAWENLASDRADPLASVHRQEREAILLAVEKLLDELDRLAQLGNETLRPRILELLGGSAREQLLRQVQAAHQQLPTIDDDYRAFLHAELDAWRQSNPRVVRFLRSLDHAAAIARPAITVSLAVSGWVLAGDLVGQAAVQAAGHTAGELATEAAITGGITGGGEAIVTSTAEGMRQAAGRLFVKLQARYASQRAKWLAEWLEGELLGKLLSELRSGAEIPQSEAFRKAEASLERIRQLGS